MGKEITQLKLFYKFIFYNKERFYHSCNTIRDGYFSKNIFIRDYQELKTFVKMCEDQDSYINYQPLKTNENRKTINVCRINLIALDIEMIDKQRPESEENLLFMKKHIKNYLKLHNITNYMLVNSGNGYHLYLRIIRPKVVNKKNLDIIKRVYKRVVEDIAKEINIASGKKLSLDDRKDIAGILRVPGTTNTKINKYVFLDEFNFDGGNKWIMYLWGKYLRDENKKKKYFDENKLSLSDSLKGVSLPKSFNELLKSPLLRIRMDVTLEPPKENEWHKTIVFALQSLIYHSGLSDHPEINELSLQYNRKCNCQIDLSECSYKKDFQFPISRALYFCNKNGYTEYAKEIEELYINS